jgi:hypothetical protein
MMRSAVHVAFTSYRRSTQKALVGKFQGKRPLGKLGLLGLKALHCILEEWDWRLGMELADMIQGRGKWWALIKMVMHLCVQ